MKGATLVRHGDAARGAFVLREGGAEARIPAPGGECFVVARLAGGDIFGEMALVEAGTCTATVVATSHVDGWFLAFEDFRAVVSQRHPASRELQHAVTLVLAERLRAVNAKLAAIASPEDRPARHGSRAAAGRNRSPALAPRSTSGLSCLVSRSSSAFPRTRSTRWRPRRGSSRLPAARCCTRRAARRRRSMSSPAAPSKSCAPSMAIERRVAVLGPGKLLGFMGVLLGAPHGTYAWVREASTLLEIPSADFRALYFGESPCASRLRGAVQRSLLESLGRTNRALTRFAAHARLAAREREAAQFEAAGYALRSLADRRLVPGYFVDGDFARDAAQRNLLRERARTRSHRARAPSRDGRPRSGSRRWSSSWRAPARAPRCSPSARSSRAGR